MSDLTEFLLARFAEDENDAMVAMVGAADGADVYFDWQSWSHTHPGHSDNKAKRGVWPTNVTPNRVMLDCEAKRQIVNQYEGKPTDSMAAVLRLLAMPYVDHPDYRKEWA